MKKTQTRTLKSGYGTLLTWFKQKQNNKIKVIEFEEKRSLYQMSPSIQTDLLFSPQNVKRL